MSLNNYPQNPNFLSPVGFRFSIKRLPNVSFFVQQANIPSVSLGTATVPTPFVNIPVPGDHITYSDMVLTFKVDEDMSNYIELYNWVQQLGFPESFDQYKSLPQQRYTINEGMYSDGVLEILNSAKKSIAEVQYLDLYPVTISEISFNSQDANINYIECTATFTYRTFKVTKIN